MVGVKIDTAEEFEEEITNADTYQATLDEHIVFLSEFIRQADMPPPEQRRPPLCDTRPEPILPPSVQPPPETGRGSNLPPVELGHVSSNTHSPTDTSRVPQVTRLPKQSLPTFSGDPLGW